MGCCLITYLGYDVMLTKSHDINVRQGTLFTLTTRRKSLFDHFLTELSESKCFIATNFIINTWHGHIFIYQTLKKKTVLHIILLQDTTFFDQSFLRISEPCFLNVTGIWTTSFSVTMSTRPSHFTNIFWQNI